MFMLVRFVYTFVQSLGGRQNCGCTVSVHRVCPGSCPMLSSCTVHLWRPPVNVADPWNSDTPLLMVLAAVLYLTQVSTA
jgi:hypothetical protein